MKKILAVLALLLTSLPAFAGTLTLTTSGFSAWPGTAPAGWPTLLTWPPTGPTSPNGTKTYTISDADLIAILTWAAFNNLATLCPVPQVSPPCSVSGPQVLIGWLQISVVQFTQTSVQTYHTTPAVVPPPVGIQ